MDNIQTIEQLDKVGLKICEMLNISIDKASTFIPETFQQYIQYVIVTDAFLLILFPIIIFTCWFARHKILHSKIVIENDEQEEVTVDKDGAVWCFSIKPFVLELDEICDCWNITCRGCNKCKYLFNLDSECILCWKELLFEWNENIESQ